LQARGVKIFYFYFLIKFKMEKTTGSEGGQNFWAGKVEKSYAKYISELGKKIPIFAVLTLGKHPDGKYLFRFSPGKIMDYNTRKELAYILLDAVQEWLSNSAPEEPKKAEGEKKFKLES